MRSSRSDCFCENVLSAQERGGIAYSTEKDIEFPVVERFVSVNGEGLRAGKLAAFIRMAGCNLSCTWCDTAWANDDSCPRENLVPDQLVSWVAATNASCVTLTGGEPVLQPGIGDLITALALSESWGLNGMNSDGSRTVEIETNGSVDLSELHKIRTNLKGSMRIPTDIAFTIDCKLPSSGMYAEMLPGNYSVVTEVDAIKFVVASQEDLEAALEQIRAYSLDSLCEVFFSPVFSCIEPAEIVAFMERHCLSRCRLQLQLHKIIWPNIERGV